MPTGPTKVDGRIPELDGIRAIAIWMVLLGHALFRFPNASGALDILPSPLFQILSHGWLGVDLFFLLSGFLITGILLDSKGKPRYFRNFYARRVLRIMPLYFAVIIVWSAFYTGAGSYLLLSSVFGANLAYLFGIPEPRGPDVLWSLAVEEHFYLLWPAVVLLLSRRKLLIASVAIFVGMPVLRGIYAARGMNPNLIFLFTWFRLDGLAAGAAMAIWAKSRFNTKRIAQSIAVALVACLLMVSVLGAKYGLFDSHTVAAVAVRYTQVYLFFGALFVAVIASPDATWTSPLRWRFMQFSGALSYCLYLVHLSVGDAYEYTLGVYGLSEREHFGPTGAVLVRVTVMIVASFAIALLSRRYLEGPILSLKERFTGRPEVPLSQLASTGAHV